MASSKCIIQVILALVLPALMSCQIQNNQIAAEEFRLPGDVYPLQHWLTIYTQFVVNDFCFWGSSEIKIKVVQQTNQIILHSSELNVDTQNVYLRYAESDQQITLGPIEFNKEFEFMIINVQETLLVDAEYIVYIPFDAPLQDVSDGYFRTCYQDPQGNEIWFSATYFEAAKARNAFVCFDEPGYKPIYSISLAHAREYTAISNMDIQETYDIPDMDGWVMTRFNDTPNLSSYLVAMMLCQFEYTEVQNLGIPVRIWGRSEVINQLSIVEKTVERVFPAFNELFAIKLEYLELLNIIAVPLYMSNQESWGCFMIDESTVIYDIDFHTIYDATLIAADISHLISHLWCGDLVTMEWWTELFLADGLAYYYQEKGVSIFFDMDYYQDIRFSSIYRSAMNDDAVVELSQAIVAPIEDSHDVLQNFTTLFQRKSYMYIRQLMMIVSQEAFLNGIRNYFNNYKYKVALLSDFLNELNNAGREAQTITADFNLNVVMERWTYGKGYPMLQVEIDYTNQIAYLSQIRFIAETRISPDERAVLEKECWPIPVSWLTSANLNFDNYVAQDWLYCDYYLEIFLENFTEQDFILFNIQVLGYYRVNYPDAVWLAIANFLNNENEFTKIHSLNRMQILSDSFEIAWPGYLPYSVAFNIIPYLRFETDEGPLRIALFSLRDIRDRLKRTNLLESFHAKVREFLEPIYMRYNDVSLVPYDITEARFKLLVDSWAGTYQVYGCLEQSLNLLLQWYGTENPDSNNPIDLNVRETAYCYGILQGNDELWNWMFQRFIGATDDDEKSRILMGLGCTQNTQIMADLLSWSLDPTIIESRWLVSVFASVYYNELPISFDVVFNFLINNLQNIRQVLENDMIKVCYMVKRMGNLIESSQELEQFQAFLNSASLQDCQSDIDNAIQDALNNISWHDLHNSEMSDLLTVVIAN